MRIYNIALLGIACFTINSCGPRAGNEPIRIENDQFVKSFFCDHTRPGSIRTEYTLKTGQKILTKTGSPYFEFVINGKITSSEDHLWTFRAGNERPMRNGGTEYTLEFTGAAGHVAGLGITIVQQLFPASTLVREKLILHCTEKKFSLNKKGGKLHFIFPGYQINLPQTDLPESTEINLASWEDQPPGFTAKKSGNHMYYPEISVTPVDSTRHLMKGPIHLLSSNSLSWLTCYEHASQDNTNGMLDQEKVESGNLINDAMQGTKGVFHFPLKNEDFKFLGISAQKAKGRLKIAVEALRGAYIEDELIKPGKPYESVWTATAFYEGNSLEKGKTLIREYLFGQICENPASRIPEFYYNTWGMQREDPSRSLRGILTYDRIFEEIEYAAELGVDIFVLDDGWEQAQGIWTPHQDRLPGGLKPIKERLDQHGMKLGLWFSPMGIDSTTSRYREHPEWVIRDSEGNPIKAQWGHHAFDFVSDFFSLFVEDCRQLIDQGCRFMKWDAINTFYSTLPDLHHGSSLVSEEERRARYEYLLPLYVVRAMEILTTYEPDLVIEIDLTEARRVMMGLAPLSQGKLFFMNNGASTYNDYSTYRTKSMRTIANEFAGLIPLELFTYASYPHNLKGAMEYNVNSSLLAGHGFWGDLSLMTATERAFVRHQVLQSKRVLGIISETVPLVEGKVGDSPEVYSIINDREAAGQVLSFSQEPAQYQFKQSINGARLLAVLNAPYEIVDNQLSMDLVFGEGESASAQFVIPNECSGITIISTTKSLSEVQIKGQRLEYWSVAPGSQLVKWPLNMGEPIVRAQDLIDYRIEKDENSYLLKIETGGNQASHVSIEPKS